MDDKVLHGPFGSSRSTDDKNRPTLPLLSSQSNGRTVGQKSTTSSIKAWQPNLPNIPGSSGLTIPFSGPKNPTRQQYELNLESRLRELVEQDPKAAEEALSSSPEHMSDLYQIAMQYRPKDYPSLILQCDRMQTLLNLIDWQKGKSLQLTPSELPSLEQFTEALAT